MDRSPLVPVRVRALPSGRVPRAAIREYVGKIVERFHPQKVILFGSHAYGKPNADSDVDILVVMPAANQINQAIRIGLSVPAPFYLDLIVRTPENLARRLKWNDWFLREIIERGIVLYDAADTAVAAKGRRRPTNGPTRTRRQAAVL